MWRLSLIVIALLHCAVLHGYLYTTVVNTNCGPVAGIKRSAYVFKSIPYAEPPVAHLRWKPPLPKSREVNNCWNGILKAFSFGNSCVQTGFTNRSVMHGDEDCLYLNVWTPTTDRNAKLPVMVYIHGGYLNYFNGNTPTYSPSEELAINTNMVYVSMNYRLNAFGFMSLDIISDTSPSRTSGNYGFMDQILALQWVQENICNFGGNPDLVTLFGHSSGGTSVFALLASPLSIGLFHRAWIISGSPLLNKTAADASKDNLVFLRNTKCLSLNCLINLPAEDILAAIPWDVYPYWDMKEQRDLPTYNFFDGAIAVVDGYVLPMAPFDAWRNGKRIDVPVIVSTTAQEIDVWPLQSDIKSWSWEDYTQKVADKLCEFPELDVTRVLSLYPPCVETPEYQYTSMASDVRMSCPNDELAYNMQNSFISPIYRYVSTSRPRVPTSLFDSPFKARYAAHGWDMYGFFGVIKEFYTPTKADDDFKTTIRREIIHFAKFGKPYSKSWEPFPRSTALMDSQLYIVHLFQRKQCKFWSKTGLYAYAWKN